MTPDRQAEIHAHLTESRLLPSSLLFAIATELLAALAAAEQERDELAERVEELHGIVFAFMTRAAEAEQERDALAEKVIVLCARMDGHVDASQQRHPTWRGVTTS